MSIPAPPPAPPATRRDDTSASLGGDGAEWLLLAYRLPDKPESLRAAVRRKLTAAGAVYLAPACAAAPPSRPAERAMRQARAAIAHAGGTAVLLTGRALAGERELAGAFNAVRDVEYDDIIAACQDAAAGLGELTAACEFRYQLLWDSDIGLRRLSASYRAVRGRDQFGAGQAQHAATALAEYRSALSDYAASVREHAARGRAAGRSPEIGHAP